MRRKFVASYVTIVSRARCAVSVYPQTQMGPLQFEFPPNIPERESPGQ